MNYELPLVLFTLLTQCAVGLALAAAWNALCTASGATPRRSSSQQAHGATREWYWIAGLSCAGLLASLLHLGDPLRAATALNNLSVSWLSREGLAFGLFTACALVLCFKRTMGLMVITALVGLAALIMQGMTYAPVSMPAIHNGWPTILFILSALALGSVFASSKDTMLLGLQRISLCVLLLLLLVVPCVWSSGNAIMQETARMWLRSPLFWAGLGTLTLSVGLAFFKGNSSRWVQGSILVIALGLTRMIFFSGTIHTATHLGLPY